LPERVAVRPGASCAGDPMPAFRFFDPWASLEHRDLPPGAAKVANAAKAEHASLPAPLAALASLADASQPADRFLAASVTCSDVDHAHAWTAAESERAAIVEHDGGIPREWAEGFARLDPERPPGDVPAGRWRRFVNDVGLFLDRWAAYAAALGWGPVDLFGCDRDRPFARLDRSGLLWLLNGNALVALAADAAVIEGRGGVRQTWRPRPGEPGRVLPWELAPE